MITDYDISLVACGGLVVCHEQIKAVIDTAKSIKHDIITVIGGGLVMYSPVEAMTIIQTADYGVIGEGEITTCVLVDAVKNKTDISKVDGIIYRTKENKLCITKERDDIPDLDKLPFPDYEGFLGDFIKERRSGIINTGRSCPFSCTFCTTSAGKKYRTRSIDNIFGEIDFLVTEYNICSLLLSDELFAANSKRVVDFCNRIMKYKIDWCVQLRISDAITLDVLALMKSAGCRNVFYGLESASDKILKSMNKRITVSMIEKTLRLTKEAGIRANGAFIFGDPEETEETVSDTLQWIDNHRYLLSGVTLQPIIIYPGSELYRNAVKSGIIDPISHILNDCPHINISKLPDEYFRNLISNVFPAENAKNLSYYNSSDIKVRFLEADDKKGYKVSMLCPECSLERVTLVEPYVLSSTTPFSFTCDCNYSGNVHLIPEYALWIDEKIRNILKKHECAMWPTSTHFSLIYESCTTLKERKDSYALINSITGVDNLFDGKKIYTPELLHGDKVDTVIVYSHHYAEIVKDISLNYPHIKPIIFHNIGFKQVD